jgi:Rho GDP-dissociation inhibitor
VKSADEYAKLDAEDESLARWKASLGVVPGSGGNTSGPKVFMFVAFYRII